MYHFAGGTFHLHCLAVGIVRAVIGETDYLGELTGNSNFHVSGENAYFLCYIFFVTKELKI